MSASMAATAGIRLIGPPNCTRSPAYLSAARQAASAMPCACAAMARRAPFMRLITYVVSPLRRSPTSSAGASVNCSSQVGEPWMPSLSSRRRMRMCSSRS